MNRVEPALTCLTCGEKVRPGGACYRCGTPAGQPPVLPTVPTRSVTGVGIAACALVAAVAVADVLVSIVVPLINRGLAQRALETLDVEPLNTADVITVVASALYLALFAAAGVVFIVWMWRAHKNLYAFPGVHPRMGPGWSIGGWFIPFANLVIPARVMNDVAKGSEPWVPMRGSVHPLVASWWTALIVSVCATRLANVFDERELGELPRFLAVSDDFQLYVDYYGNSIGRYLLGTVALAVAAVLAIVLIRRISRAQTARIARAQQPAGATDAAGTPLPGPAAPATAPETPAPGPAAPAGGSGTPS